jgi:hypothetical protein
MRPVDQSWPSGPVLARDPAQHLVCLPGGPLERPVGLAKRSPGARPLDDDRGVALLNQGGQPSGQVAGIEEVHILQRCPLRRRHPVQIRDAALLLLAPQRVRPQIRRVLQQRWQRPLTEPALDRRQDQVAGKACPIGQGQVTGQSCGPVKARLLRTHVCPRPPAPASCPALGRVTAYGPHDYAVPGSGARGERPTPASGPAPYTATGSLLRELLGGTGTGPERKCQQTFIARPAECARHLLEQGVPPATPAPHDAAPLTLPYMARNSRTCRQPQTGMIFRPGIRRSPGRSLLGRR